MISSELIFDLGQELLNDKGRLYTIEPQRSYMYEIMIIDEDAPKQGEDTRLYVVSASIPGNTTEVIKKRYMGQSYYNTGQDTSPHVFAVTFWDDDTMFTYRYMQQWYNTVVDPRYNRSVGLSKSKKSILIRMKNRFDNRSTAYFQLTDVIPTEIAAAPLAYADSSNMTFDVMFTFKNKFINDSADDYRFSL